MLRQSCYLYVSWSVTASLLRLIGCKRYNCIHFKSYVYAMFKIFIVKQDVYTVEIIKGVFVRGRFY